MTAYPFMTASITYVVPGNIYRRAYLVAGIEVTNDGTTYLTTWHFETISDMRNFSNGYSDSYDMRIREPFGEHVDGRTAVEDYGVSGLPTAIVDILNACKTALNHLSDDIARHTSEGWAKLEIATVSEGVQRLARDW